MKMIWPRLKNLYYLYHLRGRILPPPIRDNLRALSCLNIETPIAETEFIVFDTEMTGLSAKGGDCIISLSAVRLKNGRIDLSDSFHELINPNRDIPSCTAIIHEILPRMLVGKPMLGEILPGFVGYIGSSVLVAHHAWLDMGFINREMIHLYGFPLQNVVLDTAILDQAVALMKTPLPMRCKAKVDSRLSALAERYNVNIEARHTSLGDALATAQIFQRMLKKAQQCGMFCLKDLLRISRSLSYQDLSMPDISLNSNR